MKRSGAEAAKTFFKQLNEEIVETPGEKAKRQENSKSESNERRQEGLKKLREFSGKMVEVPIPLIDLSENVREVVDESSEGFKALQENIESSGVIQAPMVAVLERQGQLRLVCLAGHRRVIAAARAGHARISVAVRSISDERQHWLISIGENLVREDLHPLDIAKGFVRLRKLGVKDDELTKQFGKNKRTVRQFIKMQEEWPIEAHNVIRQNPGKFNTTLLMKLARKTIADERLLEFLNETAADKKIGATKGKTKKPSSKTTIPGKLGERLHSYCCSKKLSEREKQIIYEAIKDLGLAVQET